MGNPAANKLAARGTNARDHKIKIFSKMLSVKINFMHRVALVLDATQT